MSTSNKLCKLSYVVDDNVVSIENWFEIKRNKRTVCFVWSGLNLSSFSMSYELYVAKLNDTKGVAEIIQPLGGIC